MAGTPAGFGVIMPGGTPPVYGLAASDYAGAHAAWDALLGSTATAGKIFFGPSLYPTTLTGFPASGRLQALIGRGSRIYLCYQPGAQTDAGVDTYTTSNPAFVNQTTAQRTSLVASVTALGAACAAAGSGAVIAGVIFYQEGNAAQHNLAAGSGGNDGGYIGCVNFYGNAATGVKSVAAGAGFLGGLAPRLGFCSVGASTSNNAAYFNPGAAQTTPYDFGLADFYGSGYMSGQRLDAATNGVFTICNALGIPGGVGEMGSTAQPFVTTNGNIVSYIQNIQSAFTTQLAANHNTADCIWFDGFAPTPITGMKVASGAGTVVGSSTNTTLKTTAAWAAGLPGNNFFIQVGTEIMQVTGGSGTASLTVTRGMQGTTAISTITAGMPVSAGTGGVNIISLPGDFRIPYLRAMITAITTPGSGAFTLRQDSTLVFASAGNYGLWFNQGGGLPSTAGSLLVARFVTNDGSQTITPPDSSWVKVSSATDASTGAGTIGVARAQIWAQASGPGGLGGNQSYTCTSASPCKFTVTGAAPANGTQVCLSGTLPGGFSTNSGTVYYVASSVGSTFELASTLGGASLNSTSAVTSGGILAFPVVFTYSNTAALLRGHITEYTTPAGTTQIADQASASTAHGTTTTMAMTCTGANTQSGGLALAIIGAALTGGTTGESITVPAPWNNDGGGHDLQLSHVEFSQNGLAAGTTAATCTLNLGTWTETGWAGAMVTFYAAVGTAPLNITTLTLPGGTSGVAYTQTLTATGGASPYTWTVAATSPPLPAGLTLTTAGVLAGTPTVPGAYAFTILATDSAGNTDTQDLTLAIAGALSITTTSPLPAGAVSAAYTQTLTAAGGTAPYTWAVTSGTLPPGLALSSGGVLSGTPTAEAAVSVNVTVTDNVAATAVTTFALTIGPATSITPVPDGGAPATPMLGFPQLIVEAGFYAAAPVAQPGNLILDDPVLGLLDTGTLGDRTAWTDITAYARTGTTNRTSTRVQGPLRTYQAGTGSVTLDNSDGRFDDANSASPYYPNVRPMIPVRVRAVYGSTEYQVFSGFADSWAETAVNYDAGWSEVTLTATDGFKVLAGNTLPPLGAGVAPGELSGTRIRRILDAAAWYTDHRRIDAGNTTVQSTVFGDTALNLLQLTADTEIGELYIDGGGNVVFRQRRGAISDTRSTVPQAVFGDLPGTVHGALTELACASIGRANDDTTLANDIEITRAGGALQEAASAASIAKYLFPRTYSRTDVIMQTDAEALSYAQWVLLVSLTGEARFDTITIDPIADPLNLFPQVLQREIGDLITVYRRPQNSAAVITKPCFIRGITHTVDVTQGTWSTTWDLQDATKYTGFLTLDDAVLGKLNTGTLAY